MNIKDGSRLWTFQSGSEIKSSPVIVGDVVLAGSYDSHLYGIDAKTGKPRWKVQTNGMVHATPAVQNGIAFIAGCDAILRAIRVTDGKEVYQIEAGAYTGASPLIDGEPRVLRDVQQRGARLRSRTQAPPVALCATGPAVPLLLLRRDQQRTRRAGRPRQVRARARHRLAAKRSGRSPRARVSTLPR